jgi:hypothetical protein
MLKKSFLLGSFLILFLSSFTFIHEWTLIGSRVVNFGVDRDVIAVRGRDAFRAIKIKVVDAGLHMYDMDVVFENGEKMNVPIQFNFREGEESRVIDFPGKMRRIKKIEFTYDTKGIMKGKAKILVFGKR